MGLGAIILVVNNTANKVISKRAIVEAFHVTHAAVSNWETGRKIPEVPMLIAIAKYFEVSIDYLLGLEE